MTMKIREADDILTCDLILLGSENSLFDVMSIIPLI